MLCKRSNRKRLSCRAGRYKTPYLKPSKAEYKLRSHRWNCKSLKVKNEKGELGLMVNKIQQNFTRGNMAKIPHMIYEHLKWVIKAPAAHTRVALEACVEWVSKCDQKEEHRPEGTVRHRVHGNVYWNLPAEFARNWETRFAFPRDEPERSKFDRN